MEATCFTMPISQADHHRNKPGTDRNNLQQVEQVQCLRSSAYMFFVYDMC